MKCENIETTIAAMLKAIDEEYDFVTEIPSDDGGIIRIMSQRVYKTIGA